MLSTIARKTTMIECAARLSKDRKPITGMTVARLFADLTGERMDWHEASDYLAQLNTKGLLKVARVDGLTEYKFNI